MNAPEPNDSVTPFLDRVYFGDDDSEGDRVTVTDAPPLEGGLGTSARAVEPDSGEITVDLACDPDEETLVTVRLWGGEPAATHLQLAVDGEEISTAARVERPGRRRREQHQRPYNRFFYLTVAIPTGLTDGQESVTLTLTAGNDSPDHVYAAYTHVQNFYAPPPEEIQGEPPAPPEPSEPDFDRMRENLLAAFDEGIEHTKEWQNDDESANAYGNVGGVGSRRGARAPGNFLRAYKMEASRHHGDEELLERALANFDYHCRYQGYRGTLEIFGGSQQWIGGPDRSGIGGGLPGFMATYLARSFFELVPILEGRPELLEEEIDHDGDGRATVTRREAYTQFWRDYLWENMLLRFGVAQKTFNQITVDGTSMIAANEILKFLSPQDAAPENIIREQLRAKAGILPIDDEVVDFVMELQLRNDGEYGSAPGTLEGGRYYESQHWHWSATRHFFPLTPKGLGIEFGWAPGYSFHIKGIYMDEIADDHRISDQVRTYFDGTQHMVYPTLRQHGDRWAAVGAIGSRNSGWNWTGYGIEGWVYALLEFDHEPAKRIVRERLRYMDDFENREFSFSDSHDVRYPHQWLAKLPALRAWYEDEEPTEYRLPAEREDQYAWVDEMIGLAMVHDEDATHYFEGWSGSPKYYHRITPEYRAFGDAKANLCAGSHVETIDVGPYEIAMNRSRHRDVRVEGGPRAHVPATESESAVDLISEAQIDPSVDQLIEPYDSLVLDRRSRGESSDFARQPQPELTTTDVDETTRQIHWTWELPDGCPDADADAVSLPLGEHRAVAQVAQYYEDAATLGTGQHRNQVPTYYRPDAVGDRNPVSVQADDDEALTVEAVDGRTRRLVVECPPSDATEIEATGILPTFETYDAWTVDASGMPDPTISTENALEVRAETPQEILDSTAVTFTFAVPAGATVTRVVFTHESSWDPDTGLRTVLETDAGETLWRGTKPHEVASPNDHGEGSRETDGTPTDELVNLADVSVEGALRFGVANTAPAERGEDTWYRPMTEGGGPTGTEVEVGWYRRIRDVRIEYADETARYPHR